jgi:hypothetical protein
MANIYGASKLLTAHNDLITKDGGEVEVIEVSEPQSVFWAALFQACENGENNAELFVQAPGILKERDELKQEIERLKSVALDVAIEMVCEARNCGLNANWAAAGVLTDAANAVLVAYGHQPIEEDEDPRLPQIYGTQKEENLNG